jgi:hypothetical protein
MRIEFELLSFSVLLLIICFLMRMVIEMVNVVRFLSQPEKVNTSEVVT